MNVLDRKASEGGNGEGVGMVTDTKSAHTLAQHDQDLQRIRCYRAPWPDYWHSVYLL